MRKKYIAMIETNDRTQWSEGADGHSLSSSGRWTSARMRSSKKDAMARAEQLASGFRKSDNARPFVRVVTFEDEKQSATAKARSKAPAKTTAAKAKKATASRAKTTTKTARKRSGK